MRIVIDIPEDVYTECQGHIYFPDTGGELFNAVKNGTPLDDVKAEIDAQYDGVRPYNIDVAQGLEMALDILDNIGKAESEVKPNDKRTDKSL